MAIIAHNMPAQNTENHLKVVTEQKSESAEKLASGFKINKSADDAAHLSISEKMRWQVRGLNRATQNCQTGISMAQIAEGALSEIHDILQRMNELATQAANDTNTETDREATQKEINQLQNEIDRISATTTFNDRSLLRAHQLVEIDTDDLAHTKMNDRLTVTLKGGATRTAYGKELDFKNINSGNKQKLIGKEFTVTCSANCSQIFTFKFTNANQTTHVGTGGGTGNLTVNVGVNDSNISSGVSLVQAIVNEVDLAQSPAVTNGTLKIGHNNGISASGSKLQLWAISGGPTYAPGMGEVRALGMLEKEEDIHLQVKDKPYQEMAYTIRSMDTTALEIDNLDVRSHQKAGNSMTYIQAAIEKVSDYRSYLGAIQNRLEHTIKTNDISSENTQQSESRLRDTDMADEIVNYSRFSILENVGQSMLAHQNDDRENILRLIS